MAQSIRCFTSRESVTMTGPPSPAVCPGQVSCRGGRRRSRDGGRTAVHGAVGALCRGPSNPRGLRPPAPERERGRGGGGGDRCVQYLAAAPPAAGTVTRTHAHAASQARREAAAPYREDRPGVLQASDAHGQQGATAVSTRGHTQPAQPREVRRGCPTVQRSNGVKPV